MIWLAAYVRLCAVDAKEIKWQYLRLRSYEWKHYLFIYAMTEALHQSCCFYMTEPSSFTFALTVLPIDLGQDHSQTHRPAANPPLPS
jgi:hypothetical protein